MQAQNANCQSVHIMPSSRSSPWRVLLADDHAMLREGLALLVNSQPDMEVVGQAGDAREAILLARTLQPHIAVIDVSMPEGGGAEAAAAIVRDSPDVRVLALTRHADQASLRKMLAAGASGYVVKRAAAQALIGAMRSVLAGGTYVDPTLAGDLVARAIQPPGVVPANTRRGAVLSEREEAVLRQIAWGKSNKEVASALGISVKTAEGYRANALDKLKLRTRSDILKYALSQGWLADEDEFR
jgi:two-component system, NarL family, response regulator NreC